MLYIRYSAHISCSVLCLMFHVHPHLALCAYIWAVMLFLVSALHYIAFVKLVEVCNDELKSSVVIFFHFRKHKATY